jgi:hypothetical protein
MQELKSGDPKGGPRRTHFNKSSAAKLIKSGLLTHSNPPLLSRTSERSQRPPVISCCVDDERHIRLRLTLTFMDEVSAVCRGLVRSVVVMTFKLMVWSLYLIEIMFFTGLIGCAVAVGFSWVSIFKSGFTDKD